MNIKSLVLIFVALAIAGGTAYMARSFLQGQQQPLVESIIPTVVESETVDIWVAAVNLPIGTIVNETHLIEKPWPENALSENYITVEAGAQDSLYGQVVRHSIIADEPVTNARLVGPGEQGFVAAVLKPGMRAITVPINLTSGVAGFIFPGDFVDLILTHDIKDAAGKGRQVSETVLSNVRILAVDQRLSDIGGQPSLGQTVTVEVTPKVVEKIAVIRKLGQLSLSLRPIGDQANGEDRVAEHTSGGTYTFDAEISPLLSKVKLPGSELTVTRGTSRTNADLNNVLSTLESGLQQADEGEIE